ncbi:MAG: hypothetical protein Q8R37_04220 [Nanoarchaeota archaeon]|nr:hypothetical protein [Nanoarchaeota archaeon]
MNKYTDLIAVVRENPSELERWLVLADKLLEDGNAHGEAIANDIYLRRGMIAGEQAQEAREFLYTKRKKVWQWYADDGEQIPSSYFLENNDLWLGAFPLRFPNPNKLKELDGAFAEDFPNYKIMSQADTYASSVYQLRRACEAEENSAQPTFPRGNDSTMYRPLTFRENILARVEDFYTLYDQNRNKRTLDQRLRLFNTWLHSYTGIAYKANSPNEFKLILQSPHLIGIDEDFNEEAITEELTSGMLDYDALHGDGVITLNRNDETYNQLLTQEQVLNHPAWNAAVEEDKLLLQEYTNIVFSQRKGKNMSFWLRTGVTEDQLRALFVSSLSGNSDANSNYYLGIGGCFLRR